MTLIENLLQLLESSRGWNAAFLAIFSITVYIAAANFASRISRAKNSRLAEQLRRAGQQPALRVLFELVRMGYYLGLPFVALTLGWINLRAMGLNLQLLDWAEGMRWAIVLLLAAWLLLMAIWLPYLRATSDVLAEPETQYTFPRRLVELVYMQAHWAFYRAAAIVFLTGIVSPGAVPDVFYWGTVVGFGLTAFEAFAAPQLRERLTRTGAADGVIWNFSQAVLNALGFVVTRNLFLLIAIHFLLELTVPHLRPRELARRTIIPPPIPPAPSAREQKTFE